MRCFNFSFLRSVLVVLWIGISASVSGQDVQGQAIKFGRVLRLIESFYVDTANVNQLTENAIVEMLAKLDPHSVYISKSEVEDMNQPLEGNFEGIGISFNILQDTLIVMTTIPGGPSEKVGLRPGDRIIRVDGKNIASTGLKNQDVLEMLRGDKGTTVKLAVVRRGEVSPMEFTIVRDTIPIYSLDAAYMLDKETAFIKLNRFSATTIDEYNEAMKLLSRENKIKNLVLDLRGNGGGFLGAAYELANQFLDQNKLIVYTEGIHNPRRNYVSTVRGTFMAGNLVILIDDGTASASEIVAGAIQDWDRGLLIGRRTFGKGLVQQPFVLNDGSMIRLTTAHYYTPAGRNIQRPYTDNIQDYRNDFYNRFEKGEMFSKDSIHMADSLMTETLVTKRKVYSGGGIVPDVFVPMDTSIYYRYYNNLVRNNVLFPYVIKYIDQNRGNILARYPDLSSFRNKYEVSQSMMDEVIAAGDKEGIEKDEESLKVSGAIIKKQIKALLARDLYESGAYYQIMLEDDDELLKAIEVLGDPKLYNRLLGK